MQHHHLDVFKKAPSGKDAQAHDGCSSNSLMGLRGNYERVFLPDVFSKRLSTPKVLNFKEFVMTHDFATRHLPEPLKNKGFSSHLIFKS